LDLYAGTGALGLEALSRGAASLVCVEARGGAANVLETNVKKLGVEAAAKLMREDVAIALEKLARQASCFDGVFVDPPYGEGLAEQTLQDLDRLGLVEAGGWVSVEAGKNERLRRQVGELEMLREDCYGDTKLALYERRMHGGETA
jgi:16S rRNA (guanine966-N2)-methyltransferase